MFLAVDLALAASLTALEAATLIAFLFAESLKKWAVHGGHVAGAKVRFYLVLTLGPTGAAAAGYGFRQAGLSAAWISQALVALALVLLLTLELGTDCHAWATRRLNRRHLVRKRRRVRGLSGE
ncbi:hypothetical protein [Streptomyces aurantiogriseus]|uniref:Uncharacterized protein n=1 Tax=Streptomyces aurantiogriseus TaxID=66870 RepID=A0A918FJT9_9ACTN|nr:hypothetical protein [Streptomyces aurantiogriseus]GGR44705.1 hypothetical protein GCM10010251_72150 [Streptomyces aurantiogriseus]